MGLDSTECGRVLRRQAIQQPSSELQDKRRIDAVDTAVLVHVRAGGVGQRGDEVRAELQDERGVYGVDGAVVVDITERFRRGRRGRGRQRRYGRRRGRCSWRCGRGCRCCRLWVQTV